MLIGRERETDRLASLLAAARQGRSGVLVLRGDAGIGKTALLDDAADRFAGAGLRVLRTAGVESDAELAFSALREFLDPIASALDALPAPQQDALRGALAAGSDAPVERFAVYAATLGLLSAAAEEAPLLGLVDDVQWLDAASREALLFAARRLDAEAVVLLFAARSDAELAPSGLAQLPLAGLDRLSAAELLAREAGSAVAPHLAERLHGLTDGNPLALLEFPRALSAAQLAGDQPLDGPLPAGVRVEHAYRTRIAELPESARAVLLLAAAADGADTRAIAAAAGPHGGLSALEPAEAAGLVSLSAERIAFRHPLVRSAAYGSASGPERRAAHRTLASALDAPEHLERRAWQLAAAADGPDEEAAALLERAAARARQRGGVAAEARALDRAARLTPERGARARRLLAAARAARAAGDAEAAMAHLAAAREAAADRGIRIEAQREAAAIELWRGHSREAAAGLAADADRLELSDPAAAAALLAEVANAALAELRVDDARAAATRAWQLARLTSDARYSPVGVPLAAALVLSGEPEAARDLVQWAADACDADPDLPYASTVAQLLVVLEHWERARAMLERETERARAASALWSLAYDVLALAGLEQRSGHLRAAYALAEESVRLARETGQYLLLPDALAEAARSSAVLGRDAACRQHVRAARELADRLSTPGVLAVAACAEGILELGHARGAEAARALAPAAAMLAAGGVRDPAYLPAATDLLEALVLDGRPGEARPLLAALEASLARDTREYPHGVAARSRGLLAATRQEAEAAFDEALARFEVLPAAFERARTELCLGERRVAFDDRDAARLPLRRALEAFERLGAEGWLDRTHAALRASGVVLGRQDAREQLTPQELQVALRVAHGGTNREVAAGLLLSPRTVEVHLGRIYRKLGLRSRGELAPLFAEPAQDAEPTAVPSVG